MSWAIVTVSVETASSATPETERDQRANLSSYRPSELHQPCHTLHPNRGRHGQEREEHQQIPRLAPSEQDKAIEHREDDGRHAKQLKLGSWRARR